MGVIPLGRCAALRGNLDPRASHDGFQPIMAVEPPVLIRSQLPANPKPRNGGVLDLLVAPTGFEPATSALRVGCFELSLNEWNRRIFDHQIEVRLTPEGRKR